MMGLGSSASSSSSSSNLSPLAPPFTVERSNHTRLNFRSNLDSHFNGTSDFNSSFHSSTAGQGLLADSVRTATVPSADDYMIPPTTLNWSALDSGINPPAHHLSVINPNRNEAVPFYKPCASWSDDDDAPLVPLDEGLLSNRGLFHGYGSSQVDCSQSLSGLKYNAQQVGNWSDGSLGNQANMAGSVAYMNQGKHADLVRQRDIGPSVIGESHGAAFSAISHGAVSNGFPKELNFTAFSKFSESPEPPEEPWNSHRSYNPSYELTTHVFDFPKSPSVTIKSPAALATFSAQGAVSTKSVEISSTAAPNSNDVLVSPNFLKEKESHLPLGFEAKGVCLDVNQLSFRIGRTDDHGLRDESHKRSTDSRLNFEFKAGSNFQLPDLNTTKDVKSAANSSEDSPCWKGAPTRFSPFGSPDAVSPQHDMKKPHENSASDDRILAPTPTENDHKSGEAVVVEFDSAEAGKGQAQSSFDMTKPRDVYGFLSKPSSDTNSQPKLPNLNEDFLSSGMGIRSTDGIVDHTVPVSIENAANLVSTEIFDVNVIVKALDNLSELLLLHCSKGERGLKEQNHKDVFRVIGNLNACMSRKIERMPQNVISNMLQEGKPPVTNGTSGIFHDQAGHQERNHDHSGESIEKLHGFSLKDDDLQKEHDIVQTIKKVLDENLECMEDLPTHSLLYKNLWLEAEAELCALSYRARFYRVKREMGNSKASVASRKMHEAAAGSKRTDIHAHNPSLLSVDVEGPVMAQLNIQKRLGDSDLINMAEKEPVNVEVSGNDIQSSLVAEGPHFKRHLGKDNAGYSKQKVQHSGLTDGVHAEVSGVESPSCGVMVMPHFQPQPSKEVEVAMHAGGTSLMQNRVESGWYNASSDWEHVINDEFS